MALLTMCSTAVLSTALVLLAASTTTANPLAVARRADDCTTFVGKEKCEDEAGDNCIWASIEPGDFDFDAWRCLEKSCATVSMGESGDPATECGAWRESDGSKCTWHADVSFCTALNAQVPCEVFYADPDQGENCPSYCTWNKYAYKCVGANDVLRCDEYFTEDACAIEGCTWHDDLYKCWEKGENVACIEYQYMGQSDCPDYCKYVVIGSDFNGNEDGTCLEKDKEMACEDYSSVGDNGASCPTDHCKWYETPISVCWSKTKELECERLPGESCAPEKRCKWFDAKDNDEGLDGSCEKCATNDCVSKYKGPPASLNPNGDGKDTGAKCNTYSGNIEMDCPEPRCFLNFEGTGGGSCGGSDVGTCRDPVCTDLTYEEEECKKLGTCTYDDALGICYTTGGDYPCDDVFSEGDCNSAPAGKCEWKTAGATEVCVKNGADIPCSMFSKATCPTATCAYNDMISLCSPKDYAPPCVDYNQEGECPAGRGCAWTNGVCWEQGKELPCNSICTAFQCTATGQCQWSKPTGGEVGICTECDGDCPELKECATYTTEETCPEAACEFAFIEATETGSDTKGTCVDRVCADIAAEQECVAKKESGHKCLWSKRECFIDGYDRPCDKVYTAEDCGDATRSCTWDEAHSKCNAEGYETACPSFDYAGCIVDGALRCEWRNDGTCHILASLLPSTPPPLTGNGDGKGNEDPAQCTPLMYNDLRPKLEAAEQECIVAGRRHRRADDQQLECLAYFLAKDPAKATVEEACPCLWFFAKEISPQEDHWMMLSC